MQKEQIKLSTFDVWTELYHRIGVDPIIENAADGTLLLLVPKGKFLAGRKENDGILFKVELPGFYLGMTAVTNAQYARFLSSKRPKTSELEKWILLGNNCFVCQSGNTYKSYKGKEDHPVVRVNWHGAKAYCDWAGGRLPSELQWEKASRGVDGREYPWGNNWDETKCHNKHKKSRKKTCNAQNYPKGCSYWGHFQMAGNVWEWCEDWYNNDAYSRYKQGDLNPPDSGSSRVLRGGSWCNDQSDYFRCAYNYSCGNPDCRSVSFGFRLARNITP